MEATVEQRALSARMILTLDGHVCLSESVIEAKVSIPEGVKTTADVAGSPGARRLALGAATVVQEDIRQFFLLTSDLSQFDGELLQVFSEVSQFPL